MNQFAKELAPARKSGMKPALVACMDAGQQAAFIAQRVLELREEGASLNKSPCSTARIFTRWNCNWN